MTMAGGALALPAIGPAMTKPMLRPFAVLALVVATLVGFAAPALAHAVLLSITPADGAVTATAPEEVVLTFNEPVSPISAQLVTQGEPDRALSPRGEGERVHVPLPDGIGAGTHLVSYRVVSADGHPIAGSLIFSVGAATGAPAAHADAAGLLGLIVAVRAALYGTLLFGIGMLAFLPIAPLPVPAARAGLALTAAGGVLLVPALLLQGLDATGGGYAQLLAPGTIEGGLATSYAATLGAFAVAVVAAIAAYSTRGRVRLTAAAVALVSAAVAPALSGHASAANPQWLTRPAVAGHVASLLFWLGALPPLALLLHRRDAAATVALRRFSAAIPCAVLLLLASGVALAIVQLGTPGEAWLTPYAYILAAKLGLVAALFALALHNRLRLTQPSLHGAAVEQRVLRQSIALETGLALLILCLVAGWRVTPPPRAIALQEAATAAATRPAEPMMLMDEKAMVMLVPSSSTAGAIVLRLDVTDAEGNPLVPQSVDVELSQPERGIEPIARTATQTETGWRVDGLVLPPGAWTVAVEVRIDTFTLAVLQGEFTLAP